MRSMREQYYTPRSMLQLNTISVPAQAAKESSIGLDLGSIYKVRIVGVVG